MSNHNERIKKELLENLEYYRERSKKYSDLQAEAHRWWLESNAIELKIEKTLNELDNEDK